MDTFSLKVIASDRVFYEGRGKLLVIPAVDGEKAILSKHENMVIAVVEGEMRIRTPEGEEIEAVVSTGFVEIINNRVTVIVDTAERPEEIDIRRAEEARERAEEQLRQKQSIQEYHMSKASLSRAMTRLRVAQHKKWNI